MLSFPIQERKETLRIHGEDYAFTFKGPEVVAVDPPGKNCPLYQRSHYRQSVARFRLAQRFAADEVLSW